jgi:hypothetical protein
MDFGPYKDNWKERLKEGSFNNYCNRCGKKARRLTFGICSSCLNKQYGKNK